MNAVRRVSYVFLCVVPLLNGVAVGVRAFRVPGIYQAVGGAYFAAIVASAWITGASAIVTGGQQERRLALAGGFLLLPSTLIALLWVGLGTPWQATPAENRLRFLVLMLGSIAVTAGFVMLAQAVREAGERVYSTLGTVFAGLAGAGYLVWTSFALGAYVMRVRHGEMPEAVHPISEVFESLQLNVCLLTYLATLTLVACMGQVRWLGRAATRAYVAANAALLIFLVLAAFSYPDPSVSNQPWYLQPGFVAGIPAVPWLMPYLLGVLLLRRAGRPSPGNTKA